MVLAIQLMPRPRPTLKILSRRCLASRSVPRYFHHCCSKMFARVSAKYPPNCLDPRRGYVESSPQFSVCNGSVRFQSAQKLRSTAWPSTRLRRGFPATFQLPLCAVPDPAPGRPAEFSVFRPRFFRTFFLDFSFSICLSFFYKIPWKPSKPVPDTPGITIK